MKIFRKKAGKVIASYVVINIFLQIVAPLRLYALTGGASQPSSQGSPVGSTEMVDLFTGDFKYNIPLFELPGPDGGYPFSLNYNSGAKMDQEASWVGLGWSLSPGAINRGLNGFPDEFNKDNVVVEQDIKDNVTVGVSVSGDVEALGFPLGELIVKAKLGITLYHNNYKGLGYSISPTFGISSRIDTENSEATKDTRVAGKLSLSFDSQNGIGVSPSLSIASNAGRIQDVESNSAQKRYNSNYSVGVAYNSNQGLNSISLGGSGSSPYTYRGGESGMELTLGNYYTPSIGMEMDATNFDVSVKTGASAFAFFGNAEVGGFYNYQTVARTSRRNKLDAIGYFNLHNGGRSKDSYDFNRKQDGSLTRATENLAMPHVTADDFSVSGAGMGGVFRAFRNDIGFLHDPKMKSFGKNFNVSLDSPIFKYGAELGGGYNETISREWKIIDGDMKDFYYGKSKEASELYYLKMKGEPTSYEEKEWAYMGGDKVARLEMGVDLNLNIDYGKSAFRINNKLVSGSRLNSNSEGTLSNSTFKETKRQRSTSILSPKVKEVFKNGICLLPEYDIEGAYRDKINHPAGYTVLPSSGMRYVYGLPAYNMTQKECVHSTAHSFRESEGLGDKVFDKNVMNLKSPIEPHSEDARKPEYEYKLTNKFFKRTSLPEFAYSYLLTSVLGTDYVDVDQNGPSEKDLGYWVKFDYDKTQGGNDTYKWRAPFFGSMFNEGADKEQIADNTGSYTYGEKEMYYVEKVSTKTHVAIFHKSKRKDARGAQSEFQNSLRHGAYSYKLDSIQLFTKTEALKIGQPGETAIPLKTAHFEYTYDLCPNVQNNDGSPEIVEYKNEYGQVVSTRDVNEFEGKLTLKKVYFTYKFNKRGMLSPYEFNYNELNDYGQPNTEENPPYREFMTDKWGCYSYKKGLNSFFNSGNGTEQEREEYNNQVMNYKYPYVHQPVPKMDYTVSHQSTTYDNGVITDPNYGTLEEQREDLDRNSAVWNIKSISLPTGAVIKIDYEADDYAYVHDQPAMQMFKILGFEDNYGNMNAKISHGKKNTRDANKIYFRLTEAIDAPQNPNNPTAEEQALLNLSRDKYFKNLSNLYFNVDVYLKERTRGINKDKPNLSMPITGWADVLDVGFDTDPNDPSKYTIGWVEVQKKQRRARDKDKGRKFHPISFAGWQYMSYYMNRFVNTYGKGGVRASAQADKAAAEVKGLISTFNKVGEIFTGGYYAKAKRFNWCTEVNLDRSYIRLNNPTSKKVGGGCRVKQIALYDNWSKQTDNEEESSVYGQVYDYTKINENGEVISSGVASYEPLAGGDENPLRRVKLIEEKRVLMHNNITNFLYPLNEDMYPSPLVGYSKVTAKSIATYYENEEADDSNLSFNGENFNIPEGIMTSGAVEYEFYTTKDYPVISEETELERYTFNVGFNTPFSGISVGRYYGSQGYQVTVNNMHGAQKKITYLEQLANGTFDSKNAPYVHYKYKDKEKIYFDGIENRKVKVLDNKVKVLKNKFTSSREEAQTATEIMGVDWDVALDTRQSVGWSGNISASGDLDVIFWPFPPAIIPLPSVLPGLKYGEERVKTAVLNKVFYHHGIIDEVVSFDGQALVSSKTKVFDGLTGAPVLTTVTNQYDDEVYSYSPPAYKDYKGAGPAYESIGLRFDADVTVKKRSSLNEEWSAVHINNPSNFEYLYEVSNVPGSLVPGDEFVATNKDYSHSNTKMTFVRAIPNNKGLFSSANSLGYDINELNQVCDDFSDQDNACQHYITEPMEEGETANMSFLLTRPGNRNLLSAADQQIVSTNDPMKGFKPESCAPVVNSFEDVYGCTGGEWNYSESYGDDPTPPEVYLVESYVREISRIYKEYGINSTQIFNEYEDIKGARIRSSGSANIGIIDGTGVYVDEDPNSGYYGFQYISTNFIRPYNYFEPILFSAPEDLKFYLKNNMVVKFDDPRPSHFIKNGCIDKDLFEIYAFYSLDGGVTVQKYDFPIPVYFQNITKEVYGDSQRSVEKSLSPPFVNHYQDDILSISATAISNSNTNATSVKALNPFRNGQAGVWRASESFVFNTDRKQVPDASGEIDVKKSGFMDHVTLFDPNNYFLTSCAPEWKKVSEVTKYNADGYQIETKDILGLYSSALYNSETEQLMATAVNAKHDEVMFEDFEDQTVTGGNFDFRVNGNSSYAHEDCKSYDITFAEGKKAITSIPYDPDWTGSSSSTKNVNLSGANVTEFTNKEITGTFRCSMSPLYEGVQIDPNRSILNFEQDPYFHYNFNWAGKVTVCNSEEYYDQGGNYFLSANGYHPEIKEGFAHTGKKSLTIPSNNEYITRELGKLNLETNKEYSFQVWTSVGDNRSSFGNLDGGKSAFNNQAGVVAPKVQIGYLDNQGTVVWLDPVKPSGAMIENWQAISGTFTLPEDTYGGKTFIRFFTGIFSSNNSGGLLQTYFDDLRLCPFNSEMVSYVYDKEFYRLQATLDARNFATFYHYDDQGATYLTRVETERGIRTVMDARGHAPEKR